MKLNFHSVDLGIHTKVNVILPTGRPIRYEKREKELYQVLWLLHGGTDDCNDFIQNTNICRYAEENKIAVILPEDNDAFFTDGYIQNGGLYFSYVTEELVKLLDDHKAGKEVKIWTINKPSKAKEGADGIITNRPDLFVK